MYEYIAIREISTGFIPEVGAVKSGLFSEGKKPISNPAVGKKRVAACQQEVLE